MHAATGRYIEINDVRCRSSSPVAAARGRCGGLAGQRGHSVTNDRGQ